MAILVMGIGIPGAGKSTVLAHVARDMGMKYVSEDDVQSMMALKGRVTNQKLYDEVNKKIAEALFNGTDVVYDSTNCTRQSRNRVIAYLRERGWNDPIIACVLEVDVEIAKERSAERYSDASFVNEGISYYAFQLRKEPPIKSEGFSAVISVDMNEDRASVSERNEVKQGIREIRGN